MLVVAVTWKNPETQCDPKTLRQVRERSLYPTLSLALGK